MLFIFSMANATESYLFYSPYFNSTALAYTGASGHRGEYASGKAGIHIEQSVYQDKILFYVENETLIDSNFMAVTSYFPSQTNFKLGIVFDFERMKVIAGHECRHPHEKRVFGYAEAFSFIEFRYKILGK